MPIRAVVSALAIALALSACGSGKAEPKHSASQSPTVKEHVISSAAAKKALLTTKDVGATLKPVTYQAPTSPLFCRGVTAPTVYKETGARQLVGAQFTTKDPKADLVEEIYTYPSSAQAHAALNMVQGDMDCATGHTYNTDGTSDVMGIGASTDYAAKFTAELAYGWSLHTAKSRGIELAVPSGTSLMLFRYTAGNFSNADKLPDAFDLAITAFNRLSHA